MGYVLMLNSGDQSTGGVLSLLCVVDHINPSLAVVEPFITDGVWGARLMGEENRTTDHEDKRVQLSDIYNVHNWEKLYISMHGYAGFTS